MLAVACGEEGDAEADEDALLLLSLEGAARGTLALSLALDDGGGGAGSALRQLDLAGLDAAAPTLWAGGAPGGWLLQVTGRGVRALGARDGSLRHEWRPPGAWGPITLAAGLGGRVVAACSERLVALRVARDGGAIAPLAEVQLTQQASALALLPSPTISSRNSSGSSSSSSSSGPAFVVAAGLWVENAVLLLGWPGDGPGGDACAAGPAAGGLPALCRLELGDQQPRSLAALDVAGRRVLLAGTSQGRVAAWELRPGGGDSGTSAAGAAIAASAPRVVRVGSTSVELRRAGGGGGGRSGSAPAVYAHCDADALLSPQPHAAAILEQQQHQDPVAATDLVRASRVVGAEGLRAACPLRVRGAPAGGLAWVSPTGRLCLGALDAGHRLRWSVAPLGGDPLFVAWHAPSGCAVALTEDHCATEEDAGGGGGGAGGGGVRRRQTLRLLDGRTLRQVAALALADGLRCAALEVAELPCDGGGDGGGGGGAATRPLIVLACSVSSSAARDAARSASAGAPWCEGPPHCARDDDEGGGGRCGGALLVLDVRQPPPPSDGGATATAGAAPAAPPPGCEVALLGTVLLTSAPTSICVAEATPLEELAEAPLAHGRRADAVAQDAAARQPQGAEAGVEAGAGPASGGGGGGGRARVLLLGGEAGLAAYRVAVDGGGAGPLRAASGELRLAAAAAAAAADSTVNAAAAAPGDHEMAEPEEAPARAEGTLQRGDCQRRAAAPLVSCQRVATCAALAGGCVTALRASPSQPGLAVAVELLSSATLVRVATAPRSNRVLLLPLAADASGAMATDAALCGDGASSLLLPLHPRGLLQLRRDAAREADHLAACWADASSAFEAGAAALRAAAVESGGAAASTARGPHGLPPAWLGGGEVAGDGGAGRGDVQWWRDADERRRFLQWRRQWQRDHPRPSAEAQRLDGARAHFALPRSAADLLLARAEDAPPLLAAASTAVPLGGVVACAVRLGLHMHPLGAGGTAAAAADARQLGGSSEARPAVAETPLLIFSSTGAVTAALPGGGSCMTRLLERQERRASAGTGAAGGAASELAQHTAAWRQLQLPNSAGSPAAAMAAALTAAYAAEERQRGGDGQGAGGSTAAAAAAAAGIDAAREPLPHFALDAVAAPLLLAGVDPADAVAAHNLAAQLLM